MSLPWVEKYRPKKLHQLVGNQVAINSLLIFLQNWKKGKSPPGAILIGPSGTGKTSATYVMADELDYDITEVNASDTRTKKKIAESLAPSFEFLPLDSDNLKRIILMDEIDGIHGQKDRGGLNEFLKLVKISHFPVIATANNEDSDKINKIIRNGKFRKIKFERIDEYEILQLLSQIAVKENLRLNEDILEKIAENSAGDLRAAINELESVRYGTGKDILVKRDKMQVMRENLNDLFRASTVNDAKQALSNTSSDYSATLLHIFDQIPKQYQHMSEVKDAYNQVALADLTLQRIYKNQNWSNLKYFFNYLGPGLFYVRNKSRFTKIRKIQNLPSTYIMMGSSKRIKGKSLKLAPKVAPRLHISRKKFTDEEFYYLSKIILGKDGAEIAAWLNLDDGEIELLQIMDYSSNLSDEIEDARIKIGQNRLETKQDTSSSQRFEIDSYLLLDEENGDQLIEEIVEKEDEPSDDETLQKTLDDFF